jgi:hypothetical protein
VHAEKRQELADQDQDKDSHHDKADYLVEWWLQWHETESPPNQRKDQAQDQDND